MPRHLVLQVNCPPAAPAQRRLAKARSRRKWTEGWPSGRPLPLQLTRVRRVVTPWPPRQQICSLGSRYQAAGTPLLETGRRRLQAWRPRVPRPRPRPPPAAWVLATYWPGAGRSGDSASTGSSRASRGSRL